MPAFRVSAALVVTFAAAFAQQPRIDRVSPEQGPITGETVVTISGANFAGAQWKVDRTALVPVAQSDSEVRIQMPVHNNGYGVLSARNSSGAAYAEFLYMPPRLEELPPGYITTVAGVGRFARDYGPATSASLSPVGIAYDTAGRLYIADTGHDKIVRLNTDGRIERITAAEGTPAGEGVALDVQVTFPHGVAVDSAGNVYCGDANYRVFRIDPNGFLTTLAGDGREGFSGDNGPATAARIGVATHIAADDRDVFFVDWTNMRVRRIHLADGTISTFAGNGTTGFSGDGGPATAAQYNLGDPDKGALALDSGGNLYLADSLNSRIRRIDRQSGVITTVVRTGTRLDFRDDVGAPRSVFVDRNGAIYVGGSNRIAKFSATGDFLDSWGGSSVVPQDGTSARTAVGTLVVGLAIDGSGNIAFTTDGAVREIDITTDRVTTIAGIGTGVIGENGPALASVFGPKGLKIAPDGALLVGDTSLRLRRIGHDGNVTTIAGSGTNGGATDDLPALSASMAPVSFDFDERGEIDFTTTAQIFHIGSDGIVRRIGGTSRAPNICGFFGDNGPAVDAALCQPWDVLRDADQNLLIADTNNNRIRRIDRSTGVMTTSVGNGASPNGYEGYALGHSCGDGGPAIDACLNTPYGIALDDGGNLFIAGERDIRKVGGRGVISTFADNMHTSKVVFAHGYLYTAVSGKIVRFDRAGRQTPITDAPNTGHSGDGGPALAASITSPPQSAGIAVDADGNLFFDTTSRIRAVRYGAVLAPAGATVSATAAGSSVRAVVRDGAGQPTESVRVDFIVTPPAAASCTLSSSFAITDANGIAAVSCTPNCIAGTYSVTARPVGSAVAAHVSLTNGNGPCRRRAVRH